MFKLVRVRFVSKCKSNEKGNCRSDEVSQVYRLAWGCKGCRLSERGTSRSG